MDLREKRVLVIGGTGFLGQFVVQSLIDAGFPVSVLARSAAKARSIFDDIVDVREGDVARRETLLPAMAGCYGVHVSLHGGSGVQRFFAIEHRGVENIAEAAAEAGVERITQVSGASVYPDKDTYFVKAKYLGEQALLEGRIPAAVLRASWFMESLDRMVIGGVGVIPGRQPHPVHILAAVDFGRMVVEAYRRDDAINGVYLAYGPEPLTVDDIVRRYLNVLKGGGRIAHVPLGLMRMGTRFAGGRAKFIYDLMAYFERCPEPPERDRADEVFGANTTTLDEWLGERARIIDNRQCGKWSNVQKG